MKPYKKIQDVTDKIKSKLILITQLNAKHIHFWLWIIPSIIWLVTKDAQ